MSSSANSIGKGLTESTVSYDSDTQFQEAEVWWLPMPTGVMMTWSSDSFTGCQALVKRRKMEVLSPTEIQAGEPCKDIGWGALQRYRLGRYKRGMVRWCLQGEIISRHSVGWDLEWDSRAYQLCDFGQVTWLFWCLVSLFVKWRLVIFAKAMFPTFNPILYIEENYSIWLSLTPL